jgi:hypothetical protein
VFAPAAGRLLSQPHFICKAMHHHKQESKWPLCQAASSMLAHVKPMSA